MELHAQLDSPPQKNAVKGKKVAPVPFPVALAETRRALGDSGSWEWHCPAKIGVPVLLCWALVVLHRWHPTAIRQTQYRV